MMVGGTSALLLQMLHPGALAGVWDHSDFRRDMSGRLKRTAQFIAGTTYGDVAEAEALIAHVRAIHARVGGVLPSGRRYAADDPDLLTWVHVAEVSAFLAAYLRYVDPHLSGQEQDRYYGEVSQIATRLGAPDVPTSRAQVGAYFEAVRPELLYDDRTAAVAQALLNEPPPSRLAAAPMALVFDAAADLLPTWAADMHRFSLGGPRRAVARNGVKLLGKSMRWALTSSAEARARRRAEELRGASSEGAEGARA